MDKGAKIAAINRQTQQRRSLDSFGRKQSAHAQDCILAAAQASTQNRTPKLAESTVELIKQMLRENRWWGAERYVVTVVCHLKKVYHRFTDYL
jgi:hypothetical protein